MKMPMLAGLLVTMFASTMAAEDMAIKNQEKKTLNKRSANTLEIDYLLFLPSGYHHDKEQQWPLILFLHGAGERGTNIARVTVHGPPKIVTERPDFPFILISPQCPSDQTWADETLLGLLDEVIGSYRVDESRIYLTGLSMGGYGTWSLGLRNPERFAAIAPICGGGDILPVLLPSRRRESALKRLPVWAFHGAKDNLVLLSESERMADALKGIGNPNVRLTVYPEAGHDSWTETYNNEELYHWFLQHRRVRRSVRGAKKPRPRRK